MTTAEVTRRLDVAEATAARFADHPAVTAVLCAGSTGRGHADRWSDLELCVFWSEAPDESVRRSVAGASNGQGLILLDYDETERLWFDEWWYDGPPGAGLLLEISHLTLEDTHTLLDRLIVHHEPNPDLLAFAAALAYGRCLTGAADDITSRVGTYPRALQTAVVQRLGQIDHFWRWQMYVERDNPHGLRTHFSGVVTALIHALCGLNGRWWPGPKWPTWAVRDLPLVPADLIHRIQRLDTLAPAAAAAELTALVEETYDLVDEHLPEVDADRLRAIFHFSRRPWP